MLFRSHYGLGRVFLCEKETLSTSDNGVRQGWNRYQPSLLSPLAKRIGRSAYIIDTLKSSFNRNMGREHTVLVLKCVWVVNYSVSL